MCTVVEVCILSLQLYVWCMYWINTLVITDWIMPSVLWRRLVLTFLVLPDIFQTSSKMVVCVCFDAVGWWQEGHPACTKTMIICMGCGADLHMAQVMPLPFTISFSSKSRLVLPSWFHLSGISSPGIRASNTDHLWQYRYFGIGKTQYRYTGIDTGISLNDAAKALGLW